MNDMSINASLSTGVLAASLQQQTLGAQIIDKTLQQQNIVNPGGGQHLNPNKGNSLNIIV